MVLSDVGPSTDPATPGREHWRELVAEDPEKFGYVVPKEGATIWVDSVCGVTWSCSPAR